MYIKHLGEVRNGFFGSREVRHAPTVRTGSDLHPVFRTGTCTGYGTAVGQRERALILPLAAAGIFLAQSAGSQRSTSPGPPLELEIRTR